MSVPEVNGGVSRCGRVRKKTAKLMEMEESETVPTAATDRPPVRPVLTAPPSARSVKKKSAKIRTTSGGEEVLNDSSDAIEDEYVSVLDVQPFECEEIVSEEMIETVVPEPPILTKTVPSLRIKLNHVKGTAELEDRTNTHSLKRKGSSTNGSEASDRKKAKKSVAPRTVSPVAANNVHHTDHFILNNTSNHSHDLLAEHNPVSVVQITPVAPKPDPKKKANNAKSAKSSKSTPGTTVKRTNVTAYTLWCKENRPKVQKANPDMDFASASRALGEIWQGLSNNEKLQWKLKADKIKNGPVLMRETGPPVPEPVHKNHIPASASVRTTSTPHHQPVRRIVNTAKAASARAPKKSAASESITLNKTGQLTPVDVSAYLRLVGESLSAIGRRLSDQRHQMADSQSLSPLLDSTLCALAPLLALTSLDPRLRGCDPSTLSQTLENISSIMPGI